MKEKKFGIIRVSSEVHHMAKIVACQNLITLQKCIERLIKKEYEKLKIEKTPVI